MDYPVSHVMSVIGVMTAASLLVSLACWALLGKPLQGVLKYLCDDPRDEVKEVSGSFWKRLYILLIMMVPLLMVLLFAPEFGENIGFNLLYAMRAAFMGGVTVLLVLAFLVRRQIQFIQSNREPVAPKVEEPKFVVKPAAEVE